MFYRLLGMAVWKGGRLYLRSRYAGRMPTRPIAALVALLVVGAGVVLLAARRGGDSSSGDPPRHECVGAIRADCAYAATLARGSCAK